MIAAELTVVGGKHAGQVISLNRRKFLIGREQDCQLRPNSEMVSRHHCVFSLDDYSVRLRDLGSTNGTFVNGVRIQKETVLAPNDLIVIGNLEFKLTVRAEQASESNSSPGIDLRAQAEDTQVTSHTVMDMPIAQPAPAESMQTPEQAPAAAMAPTAPETTILQPGGMMPQQPYGYPPQMVPPMGYPGGMYGGYPYQQMMPPGFGQMYNPMMAPGMGAPMGYPMPGMMPQMPTQPTPPAPPAATTPPGTANVVLPDPAETGAKEGGQVKGSAGSNRNDTAKPTGAADAIIKQMMNRRPGT